MNEVGLRGYCPVRFKDLRTTIVLGWAWVRRRVSVGVRTAISLQRENDGRESDLMCLRLDSLWMLDSGARGVASNFKSPCALTIKKSCAVLLTMLGTTLSGGVRVRDRKRTEDRRSPA